MQEVIICFHSVIVEPLALEPPAARRRRALLELGRVPEGADAELELGDLRPAQPRRPEQLAIGGPRVAPADRRGTAARRIELRREAQVLEPALLEHVTGEIVLGHALHDNDFCRALRVVEPRGHDFVPPLDRAGKLFGITTVLDLVRIVHTDDVAPFAGPRALHARREPATGVVVLKAMLHILIGQQMESASPALSKPR